MLKEVGKLSTDGGGWMGLGGGGRSVGRGQKTQRVCGRREEAGLTQPRGPQGTDGACNRGLGALPCKRHTKSGLAGHNPILQLCVTV